MHLKSGEVLKGEVVEIAASELTIGWPGNYGLKKRSILISEIDKVEVNTASKTGSVFGGAVGFVGLGFSALVILFLLFGDVDNTG